ncbi:MAG: hypothetical protein AAGC81_13015 [Pseudomonadota bacterium]
MKIVENTDEKLVLSSRPWVFAGMIWLAGFGLIANGVFALGEDMDTLWMRASCAAMGLVLCGLAWRYIPFITVEFDRARGQMLHQSHRLIRPGWFKLDLDRIKRARLEAQWSDSSRTTRLVLEIEGDVVPLEYGGGAKSHYEIVEAINEWLTRPV